MERDGYAAVLVLTAQSDTATRLRALESGAKDYLTKPFDRLEVLTRMRNMLEVRLLHNQIRDQNKILEHKVRQRTQELMETRMEIIRRLGRAAEYRDNETGLHIIRMSKFSEILGRTAGMDADWCEMLLNASPMHDIGKIGIPDRILLKPGKFEPEEWEIMKTHAAIGAEILSGHHSDLMEMARVIAITHHEKWDGTGYPNGLKGEDIPLVGRIVALADVFDALTSERPYKKAWSVEDALGYLLENRGMHFDPNLVGVFEKVLPEILAVREQYAEPPAPSAEP
jgi:putative two-component system response regulator